MILPGKAEGGSGRHALYLNAYRESERGRDERRLNYARWRRWHLAGREDGVQSTYNKLAEFTDTSRSYIFAPEATRFGIALPAKYGDDYQDEQEAWRDELHRWFHDSGVGGVLELGVEYAHPYDSTISKVYVSGVKEGEQEVCVSNIQDPSDLCVLDEKLPSLDDQEILCHFYTMSVPRFRRMVSTHPNYRQLVDAAESYATPGGRDQGALPPAINSMIINASYPTMIGSARGGGPASTVPVPRVEQDLVNMCELWVWDDDEDDYRVVTIFLPTDTVIREKKNPLVPKDHPFKKLTLLEDMEYLWGQSTYEGLYKLQAWRERRLAGIDKLLDLQVDPPIAFYGVGGLVDEKAKNLREPGGDWSNGNPMAKAERMAPAMPPDAFAEIEQIDAMFAKRGGLPQLLQGVGEPGMRAGNQASVLATLGAARLMRRAMRVESWAEAVTTYSIRLLRRLSPDTLEIKTGERAGKKILMSQIPSDFVARVAAHSASPLFADQLVAKAFQAWDRKLITREMAVELIDLPMHEKAKADARKIDENQAKLVQEQLKIQHEKATKTKA